jgi:hypothetical protein
MVGMCLNMVYQVKKKNFLFIEPCSSCQFFLQQAKVTGSGTFVISGNDAYLHSLVVSAFFQVDTHNEKAVLALVKQLAEKFEFERVIAGSGCYESLTVAVSTYLQQSGLHPDVAFTVYRKQDDCNSYRM